MMKYLVNMIQKQEDLFIICVKRVVNFIIMGAKKNRIVRECVRKGLKNKE